VVGETLDGAGAFYIDQSSSTATGEFVRHDPGTAVTMGTSMVANVGTGSFSEGVGNADDFYVVQDADIIYSSLGHFVSGVGIPILSSGATACAGHSFTVGNVSRVDANTLVVGGSYNAVCKISLTDNSTTLISREQDDGGNYHAVDQTYGAPTGEVFWVNSDYSAYVGTINQLGAGTVGGPFPDTMSGIGGTSAEDVWAVTGGGDVYQRQSDGGFALHTSLHETAYGIVVTPDGVFVNAFTSIKYRTQFTDGGFQSYLIPGPVSAALARNYHMVGGPGFLHLAGDYGPVNTPSGQHFITFSPRTGF
jgi:hypothetical protein